MTAVYNVRLHRWASSANSDSMDQAMVQLHPHHLVLRLVDKLDTNANCYLHIHYALILNLQQLSNGGFQMITRTHDIWQWTSNGNPIESKQLWVDLQRHYQNSLNNGTTLTSVATAYALHLSLQKCQPRFKYHPQSVWGRWGMAASARRWRISHVNQDYRLTETMFPQLIVPAAIQDSLLLDSAKFRSFQRCPHVVYHHALTKAVLVRSGQPLTGSKQRRSIEDEQYIQSILWPDVSHDYVLDKSKLPCIVDARTKNNAMQAKWRGGGHEADGNYTGVRMFFTSIESPQVIQEAYCKFVEANRDSEMSTGTFLENISPWLKQVQSCLRPASFIAKTIATDGASCLIHCDDGLDLTSVLVSLVKIMMDPFYRTLSGFQHLIEEDWIQAGYPFRQRSVQKSTIQHSSSSKSGLNLLGQEPGKLANQIATTLSTIASNLDSATASGPAPNTNNPELNFSASFQFSPVFPLFLDCVYQIITQFPVEFEFTSEYLLCIHEATMSCKFGTFLGNTPRDYQSNSESTVCFWTWLSQPERLNAFRNHAYLPTFTSLSDQATIPSLPVSSNSKAIKIWKNMYQPFDSCNPSFRFHYYKWMADWAVYMTPKISADRLMSAEQLLLRELRKDIEVTDAVSKGSDKIIVDATVPCEQCGPICVCNINVKALTIAD